VQAAQAAKVASLHQWVEWRLEALIQLPFRQSKPIGEQTWQLLAFKSPMWQIQK
jgi:hypothetical protein